MRKLFICAFLAFQSLLSAQAQDCPRIFQRGDTLYTDPAPQYQWFRDQNPIPGATNQWYLPPVKGNYAVQIFDATPNFAFNPQTSEKSIMGRIVDERYEPIANATVSFGNTSVKSDAKGQFQLNKLKVSGEIAVVTITKAGFWKNVQRVHFFNSSEAPLTAMLEPLKVTNRFDAMKGATISERGFFLTFPPNAIINESGQTYQGMVHLSLKRSFPQEEGFGLRMPGGDFSAIDQNGQEKILVSYGFMSAEMQTPGGEKLRLSGEATLEFYQPWEQNQTAPDSMPLWHFDETKGMWMEEGIARKVGPRYVGTVKHFSSWNCDVPEERATVKGKVVDCHDNPIPYKVVRIGEITRLTDSTGSFQSYVPRGTSFYITSGVDTVFVDSLDAGETRDIGVIESNHMFGAVGLIDSTGTLTVYGYGLESYSVDSGQTFHPKSEVLTFNGNFPTEGIGKDSAGCEVKIRIIMLPKQGDCQMLDSLSIYNGGIVANFGSIEDALAYDSTVYGFYFMEQEVKLSLIAELFPCVQKLAFRDAIVPDFSESIGLLTNLQWLSANLSPIGSIPESIDSIPESIGQLTNLRLLSLRLYSSVDIPQSMINLRNLEWLTLSHGQLSSLPDFIGSFTKLNHLNLRQNLLTALPESIGQLSNLQNLYLDNNQLHTLPDSIGGLQNLYWLNLRDNQLRTLPESFGQLSSLQNLYLEQNQLTSLPESFGQLSNLANLSLGLNQLPRLPESFGQLTSLRYLDLSSNRLSYLPESIGDIPYLFTLHLASNELNSLPESIGNLSTLDTLFVGYNRLTSLPESIGNLSTLRSLDLQFNQLWQLPETFGQLYILQQLWLTDNQLSDLPLSFNQLDSLRVLHLSSNQFTTLPESIGQLTNLRELSVNNNNLFTISETIFQLTGLQSLDYGFTGLTFVPESIGQLNNLQSLTLNGNQLTTLPESISNLRDSLINLNLRGNPISKEEKARIRAWLPNATILF